MTQNQIAYWKAKEEARHNVEQELTNREQAKAKWMDAIANVAPYAAATVPGTSQYMTENASIWDWINLNTAPGAKHTVEQEDYKSVGSLAGGLGKLLSGLKGFVGGFNL